MHPNLDFALKALAQFKANTLPHYINGEAIATIDTFETLNPYDNALLAHVSKGEAHHIDQAARAAKAAFPVWCDISGERRAKILHKIADKIEARAEEIALVESSDTGQCIRYMSKAAVRGAENFRFFADKAANANNGVSLPTPTHLNYTIRQPIGAVGIITPWNTPFMLSTWKIAPALASGCTVVHKPAELSPLSATLLTQIIHEVLQEENLPLGIMNLVHGFGESAGKALTQHKDIKAIAFVGETITGSHIMRQGADTLKRVHFELGGKNPVIVFKDANLDKALDAVLFMIYSLNGERCTSSSRVLIEESIYESFTDKLKARIAKIKVGHPLDPKTEIGPLIHETHTQKVMSYIKLAASEGAKVTGGECNGNLVSPTLFTHATQAMQIANEEIFGPVLTAISFKDEAEALAVANAVEYGLAAYIWTENVSQAHRFATKVEAGMVWVNSENVRHLETPFGGVKNSGIGRDGGDYSFDFYMETKNIAIAMNNHTIPKIGV